MNAQLYCISYKWLPLTITTIQLCIDRLCFFCCYVFCRVSYDLLLLECYHCNNSKWKFYNFVYRALCIFWLIKEVESPNCEVPHADFLVFCLFLPLSNWRN